MSTSQTPLRVLEAQAEGIAHMLKRIAAGDETVHDPGGKLKASLAVGIVTVGVMMDDKFIKITVGWDAVRETSEVALAQWVLTYMQGQRKH